MLNITRKAIGTVSGKIGSGKTRTTLKWYDKIVDENMGVLVPLTIATPTNGLSKEYQKAIDAYNFPSVVISQEEGYRSSAEEYRRRCETRDPPIAIVNHSIALGVEHDVSDRILILDETWSPIQTVKIRFRSPDDVAKIGVKACDDVDGYYEVISSDVTEDMIEQVKEDQDINFLNYGATTQELAMACVDKHYRVVIDTKSFDEAGTIEAFEKKKMVILQFTIFQQSSVMDGYKEVLYVTAEQPKTLVSLMWSKDVDFQPNEWIESQLDQDYLADKAPLVTIRCPEGVKNLSKHFFKTIGDNDRHKGNQLYLDRLADAIDAEYPNKDHIFCTNTRDAKSTNPGYAWKLECPCRGRDQKCTCEGCGKRVIVNPHGLNALQKYNMAVFGAAINFDPVTRERLSAFYGITPEQAKEALCWHMIMQFSGRTSIRNPNSSEPIVIVAPDENSASYLKDMLPEAMMKPFEIHFGERPKRGRPKGSKRVFRTDEERKAKNAADRRAQRAAAKAALEIHA